MSVTPAATFCATLVDEWILGGVRHAVVAPGSRSTPLALALSARSELQVHVVLDERSAAFVALGVSLASGVPAVLLCTSGTAAAEFHAAVVEAHQAEVPLIVCTADRPPELRDVGAPQTIDQWRLYGAAVRWFHDSGVPDDAVSTTWRPLAARSVLEATGSRPGPVHLNLPFREPLVGEPGVLPVRRAGDAPWIDSLGGTASLTPAELAQLVAVLDQQRGVIVAGGGPGVAEAAEAIHRLADQLGWPVLADWRSGARLPRSATVAAFDPILRSAAFAAAHAPTVVLRIGTTPASKVLAEWIATSGATEVQVHASSAWLDSAHHVERRVVADPSWLCAALDGQVRGASGTPWSARWRRAESRAQAAIDEVLAAEPRPTEPAIARTVLRSLPEGGRLVVSSSMPVRDTEWFGAARAGVTVHSNRGANGIDGVVSTAIGVALASGAPTTVLVGDLAFLHDSSALVALRGRPLDLTIVVVDNDGGGIFSFLPQATALTQERFELLFGTPHGTSLGPLAAAHGLDETSVASMAELAAAVAITGRTGARVLRLRTDRTANVELHRRIERAVIAAL